jgi:hypothetical protein
MVLYFAAIFLVLIALLLFALSLSHSLVARLAALDKGSEEHFIPADLAILSRLLTEWGAIFLGCAFLVGLVSRFRAAIPWPRVQSALWTLACSALLLWYLSRLSYESDWYPLNVLIQNSRTLEVFSRRPLFIWPARWLHDAAPGLSYLRLYWIVQAPVILATMIAVRKWSELFITRTYAFLGQILTIFLLAPMFSYYTFYDVGIVLFYTAGLLALWNRAYLWLAVAVGIGALNHENTLLLVFVAAVVSFRREPRKVMLRAVVLPLLSWSIVRFAVSIAIPMPKSVHFRILTNLWELLHAPGAISFTALAWVPLMLLTLLGWKAAPSLVRQIAISLAIPLLAVTYLFGKFREPRQLDAYIPVAVALALVSFPKQDALRIPE